MNRILQSLFSKPVRSNVARRPDRFLLAVQPLEARTVPAAISVINTNNSGAGSLRAAVTVANLTPGADTITFDPSIFNSAKTISLTSGEILISESLTLTGPTAKLTLDAGANSRHFFIDLPQYTDFASISNLSLINGSSVGGNGGGSIVTYYGALNLTNVDFTNCTSDTGGGALVAGTNCILAIDDCTFSGNEAKNGGRGGAIHLGAANTTITRTTIANNKAGTDGGGIAAPFGGSLRLTDSTISGNQCDTTSVFYGLGGGISMDGGALTLTNTTIIGNQARIGGGVYANDANVDIDNCTIVNNQAASSGGGVANSSISYYKSHIEIRSTIVSGNGAPAAPDIRNEALIYHSLIQSLAGTIVVGTPTGNIIGVNPMLGVLADNGGPTMTCELPANSPAINAGSNYDGANSDQRGAGFARVSGGVADIGAYERQSLLVTNADDAGVGSLRQAIVNANLQEGADTITFAAGFFNTPRTITLATGQLSILQALTITGPTAKLTIDAAVKSRHFTAEDPFGSTHKINLSNLTLINGKAPLAGAGGSIYTSDEALTLTNVTISKSSSPTSGGAVYIQKVAGSLTATDCTFSNNTATGAGSTGGALSFNAGSSVTLTDCTFDSNSAGHNGGAVHFLNGGTLTLVNSTISGNAANTNSNGPGGGGLFLKAVTAVIRNCTIAENAALSGGGITVFGSGTLTLQNSTISHNSSQVGGGGVYNYGKGVINLTSTIVAANKSASGSDIDGNVTANFSLIGSTSDATVSGANNKLNVSPLIATLASNGAAMKTVALLAGSPAINTGSNPAALSTDQRGAGFPRVLGGSIDIGAHERLDTVVTSTKDAGVGSLRQVVLDTNAVVTADTVTFDPVVFAVPRTIFLTTGSIAITDAVEINGPTAALTLHTGALSRHFAIDRPNGSGSKVGLSSMTLTAGRAIGASGGAIHNVDEALTLTNVTISNSIGESNGGAIYLEQDSASLKLIDSTLRDNAVTGGKGRGGALFVLGDSTVSIVRSTLSGNTAPVDGGGVYFLNGGFLSLIDSTVSGNSAGTNGGGLYLSNTVATLRNSTLSGNKAAIGGGIAAFGLSDVSLNSCTIANNTATSTGGGVFSNATAGISLFNTLVATNTALAGPNLDGKFAADYSLVGKTTGATVTGSNNLLNATVSIGALADNGGPTKTHSLLAGNPAINKGSNVFNFANDQRGVGFARTANGSADIGAFEVQAATACKVSSVQINDGSAQRSRVTSLTITFDSVPTMPVNPADAFQLYRQSDNKAVVLSASVAGNSVTLTFTGGPIIAGSLDDGRYTLTALAAQIPSLDGNSDGTPGDDYVLVGNTTTNKLFRLFGDADGDADVDNTDFVAFRTAFGNGPSIFDADGDSDTDNADFVAFRGRFGTTI